MSLILLYDKNNLNVFYKKSDKVDFILYIYILDFIYLICILHDINSWQWTQIKTLSSENYLFGAVKMSPYCHSKPHRNTLL